MPIVLDNTQGSTLGMAMSQHAIDKMVGQRMQMTDIYAKTNQLQGQLLQERGMAELRALENISGGFDPKNPSHVKMWDDANRTLDAGNEKLDRTAYMTATHSEDIQGSDYNSFKNLYSRDAYYQNLEDNSYEPSRKGGMLASIGNKVAGAIGSAAGAIGDAASSAYNSVMGPSKTDNNASGAAAPTSAPATTTSSSPDIKTALDNIKAKYNLPFENQPAKPLTTPQNDFTQIYKSTAFNPSPMRK